MKQTQQDSITKNELLDELRKAGFNKVSKRDIGDWRREQLLPAFANSGRGLGKGQGKTESTWKNPKLIINQAKWISRMKSANVCFGDIKLNLWMLGYPIPLDEVRELLLEPLSDKIELLNAAVAAQIKVLEVPVDKFQHKWKFNKRSGGVIEDIIDDAATDALANVLSNSHGSLAIPQAPLEAIGNIFFNPDYDLSEFGFAEGLSTAKECNDETQRFVAKMLGVENIENSANDEQKSNGVFDLLNKAEFIQQHFSLHQLEKSVKECTDKDLMNVQKDLRVISKIVKTFASSMQCILPHIRKDLSNPADEQFLPFVFGVGEMLVLADISFRRNGYAQAINNSRTQVLIKVKEEIDENIRKEFELAAPEIGRILNETFDALEHNLMRIGENSVV